ncbi:unnamed protein product, partial [Prorocentrum cordatum]
MCCTCGGGRAPTPAANTTSATTTEASATSTETGTATAAARFVLSSSMSFESSGARESVQSAVMSHLLATYGVGEDQLSVAVSRPNGPGWRADVEVVASGYATERHVQTTRAMRADVASTAAALNATFTLAGMQLLEASLAVSAPETKGVVVTVTTAATTTSISGTAPFPYSTSLAGSSIHDTSITATVSPAEVGHCLFNYTSFGASDCDAAWALWGLTCENL